MFKEKYAEFLETYNLEAKDEAWKQKSAEFRLFWEDTILPDTKESIDDSAIDAIVRILDRYGRGNTKDSLSVAKAMIPQGAWRRLFNDLHQTKELKTAINDLFKANRSEEVSALIDKIFKINSKFKNNLTGETASGISCLLAAYNPFDNFGAVSLNHRYKIIEHFKFPIPEDCRSKSTGTQVSLTATALRNGTSSWGIEGPAFALTAIFYSPQIKSMWEGDSGTTKPGPIIYPAPIPYQLRQIPQLKLATCLAWKHILRIS